MNTKLNLHKVTKDKAAFNSLSRSQRAITMLWQPLPNPDSGFNMKMVTNNLSYLVAVKLKLKKFRTMRR